MTDKMKGERPGGGQLLCSGYDPQIDFLKGVSILWVLLTHCIPYDVQDKILFCLWGAQAVPLFIIIQVFHSYKKGLENVSLSIKKLKKLWNRIIRPFLITIGVIYVLYLIYGYFTHVSITEQTIKFLKSGGAGPGSYYFGIYLQFVLILPIMAIVMKRFKLWGNLILLIAISEILEVLCCLIHFPDWLYRLLFFRYFFLIYIGFYLVKKELKLNIWLLAITTISCVAIMLFKYGGVNTEPFFLNSDWESQHWICYGYLPFLIYALLTVCRKTNIKASNSLIRIIGKCSYEIFLWQMIYFLAPIQPILIKVFKNDVIATLFYIILSMVVCVTPVLYLKQKKELREIWNTKM